MLFEFVLIVLQEKEPELFVVIFFISLKLLSITEKNFGDGTWRNLFGNWIKKTIQGDIPQTWEQILCT